MTAAKAHVASGGAITSLVGRVRKGRHQVGLDGTYSPGTANEPKQVQIVGGNMLLGGLQYKVFIVPRSAMELAGNQMKCTSKAMFQLEMFHNKNNLEARDMLLNVVWHGHLFERTSLLELALWKTEIMTANPCVWGILTLNSFVKNIVCSEIKMLPAVISLVKLVLGNDQMLTKTEKNKTEAAKVLTYNETSIRMKQGSYSYHCSAIEYGQQYKRVAQHRGLCFCHARIAGRAL
jgi:hypothetical protein